MPWLPPAGGVGRRHHVLEAVAGAGPAVVARRPAAVRRARLPPGRPASPATGSPRAARPRYAPRAAPRRDRGAGARTSRWTGRGGHGVGPQVEREVLRPLLEGAAPPPDRLDDGADPAIAPAGDALGQRGPAGRASAAGRPGPAGRRRAASRSCDPARRRCPARTTGTASAAWARTPRPTPSPRRPRWCWRPIATQLRASSAIPRVSSSVSVGSPVRKYSFTRRHPWEKADSTAP